MLLTYGYEKVHKLWHVEESPSSVFLRIYWVTDGEATYCDKKTTYALKKGHLYVFPTNSPYQISHNPNNPLTCMYLHMEITPYVLSTFIELDLAGEELLLHLCSAFLLLSKDFPFDTNAPLQRTLSQSIVEALVHKELFEVIDTRVAKSIDFMIHNLSQNISIDEIGKISGYHPKYFCQIFKKNIGITPHQFLIQYRMKHALTLLQNNHSILEAAVAIGYTDSKSFSKMFFKIYGIQPSKAGKKYFSMPV